MTETTALAAMAEAVRLWYVRAGRNPRTGSYDQPQPAFIVAALHEQGYRIVREDAAPAVPEPDDGLCRWPCESRGETLICGLYRGHPTDGVQYGHHFVASSRLPAPAVTEPDLRAAALDLCRVAGRYIAGDSDIQPEDVHSAIEEVRAALAAPAVTVQRAVCVCGAEPPSRPWTPGVANPCRDGNGNWRPGHGYATPAVTEPHVHRIEYPSGCTGCEHLTASFVAGVPEWMRAAPAATEPADALAKVAAAVKGLDEYWCEPNDTGHGHVRTVAVLRAIEDIR